VGLARVYAAVAAFHASRPDTPHWQPSGLLQRLAQHRAPLSEWKNYLPGARTFAAKL
jgi:hypothetical protein